LAATAVVACALLAASVSSASALTLGTTTFPAGAMSSSCSASAFYTQTATDASYDYTVPASGGTITHWSTNTTGAVAGANVTLLVLRPATGSFTLVGYDPQVLPTPLPVSNVATFALATPLSVDSGDVLAITGDSSSFCMYAGGGTPVAEVVSGGAFGTPTIGGTYSLSANGAGYLVNVSAELAQSSDTSITATTTPAKITAGGAAAYGFSVKNNGPGKTPITFKASVPAGISVLSAAAGAGDCSTSGQDVSCTITGLAAGSSAPVVIVVSAPSAGSYATTGKVSTPLSDPNAGDNSATATLTVDPVPVAAAPPLPTCTIVSLKGLSLTFVKQLLPALNCTLGKVTKKASKSVGKGLVISTTPGKKIGLPNNTKVNVVTSSGPPKKKAKPKKKTKKTSSKK